MFCQLIPKKHPQLNHGPARPFCHQPPPARRVFSFLAGDTPLKGELPKVSGLDDFLTRQREVVMTLSLARTAKISKRGRRQQPRGGNPVWLASGWAGEAKLGLGQFRNDHVQKIELQAPLLLSGGGSGGGSGRRRGDERSQMLLVKVHCSEMMDTGCRSLQLLNCSV